MDTHALANAVIYSVLGILIFALAFVLIDKLTPYHLWKEIVEDKNVALAILDRRHVDRHVHHHRRRGALGVDRTLFLSVFLIAACGLIYELIAGTLASYLLGDTVFQFSTIIGCYLFAMGIGSYLSRFLHRGLVARFRLHRADGRSGRRILVFDAVSRLRLHGSVSVGPVCGRDSGRHSGRPRNSPADADIERALPVSRAGFARPDVRLSGRAGRVAAVSRFCWFRSSAWFARHWCLEFSMPASRCGPLTCFASRSAAAHVAAHRMFGRAGCPRDRNDLRGSHLQRRRQQPLCRRSDLQPQYALSAHRAHQVERRSAALPEFASAVQLAR